MRKSLEQHFRQRVDRRGPDECWPWLAGTRNGYGRITFDGRRRRATEVALHLAGVHVPAGMVICHRCDNPICVNPAHLFVGTRRDNFDDMVAKGRDRLDISPSGQQHHAARLTEAQVLDIRRRHSNRKGVRAALALEFGVKPSTITDIANGRSWRHLPLRESA